MLYKNSDKGNNNSEVMLMSENHKTAVSLWNAKEKLPSFSSLSGSIKTDVLIIGGGLAGLLTAYKLKEKGTDCVLAEKGRLMSGISGNTTAKITAQHGLVYHKLLKSFGKEKASQYLKMNLDAIEDYSRLAKKIHCDFERRDNYVYSTESKKKLCDEMNALGILGYEAQLERRLPIPVLTFGAVRFFNQAQFNPVKFARGLLDGMKIYENTFVHEIEGTKVKTDEGEIKAEKIVVATHFPFINSHGLYFAKLYQHRSYVVALSGAEKYDGMYVDDKKDGMSFRNYGDLLLLGGGDHRTGKKGGGWRELRNFAEKSYPSAKEEYHWAAQDCMSLDDVPYVGHYSKNTQEIYVATGFNKWGMSGSMAAANVLADMITEKDNEYEEFLSPSRSIMKPQLLLNGFETAVSFLTPTKKRCPHLGCALKWNSAEHSWDCPCHGSRFDEKGKLLDNPSNGNLC